MARSLPVSVQTVVSMPAERTMASLESRLNELQSQPGHLRLSVDLAGDLQSPIEAALSVPVVLKVSREPLKNELYVRVAPATKRRFYPCFKGLLHVLQSNGGNSKVLLEGTYVVPLGALGRGIDITILRGVAQSSLQRFLDDLVKEGIRTPSGVRQ